MVLLALLFFSFPLFAQGKDEKDPSASPRDDNISHACAPGVCYSKLEQPLHLKVIENVVDDSKVVLQKLDPKAVEQAEKCLLSGHFTVDEKRVACIGLFAPSAQDSYKKYGIPASITIGQGIEESGWGKKMIIGKDPKTSEKVLTHNYFGVKAREGEPYVLADTKENINGKEVLVRDAKFRRYASLEEATDAHGEVLVRPHFLEKYTRHGFAPFYDDKAKRVLRYPSGIEDITNFMEILQTEKDSKTGKKEFTYATNPNYAKNVVNHIKFRKNKLMRFDTFQGKKH